MNCPLSKRITERSHQRGAVTAIMVAIVLVVIAMMTAVTLNRTTSDVYDTAVQNDSTSALFLAESGAERATKRYSTVPTCTSGNFQAGTDFALGRGTFRVEQVFTTDFTGAALPPGQCRVRVRGNIATLNVTRTVEVVLKSGGLGGVVVDPGFDDPNRWKEGADVISGSKLNLSKDNKKTETEKKAPSDPENGILPISPAPGVVPLTLCFDYVVVGTLKLQFKIKFEGEPEISFDTPTFTDAAGTHIESLGSRDPNLIKEIKIEAKNIDAEDTVTLDNFYLGPSSGAACGSGGTPSIVSWREMVF